MGYPELPLGPKIMLRQEKVQISLAVLHSGRKTETRQKIDTAHVQVEINEIFLQILKALSIGKLSQFMVNVPKCAWISS